MSESFDPFLLENQLCFPLYAASKAVVRRYEPLLSPFGITYTQYIVLLVLWEKDDITVNELGERVYLDSGTLSPLLRKLEAKGYIIKSRKEDGRYRRLLLTEEGRALKGKLSNVPYSVGSCIHLAPEEAKALYDLCYKTLESVSEKQ